MKRIALLVVLTQLIASCAIKTYPDSKDLEFIYSTILENHPGIYNERDADFRLNLENSYSKAKEAIKQSKSNSSSKNIISDIATSFNDEHLWGYWFDNRAKKQSSKISNFSISDLSDEVSWIRLPSFSLKSEQENNFNELIKHISNLRIKKYIVFDLRGNQGGNSDYGTQIIKALFGNEYANYEKCINNKKLFADWRASEGNLSHISSLLDRYPSLDWLQDVKDGLKESLDKGEPFYREYSSQTCKGANLIFKPDFKFQIIVITDSLNVSAALDFIDELKIMTSKITLIGQKTKADRLYMEVRSVKLPSGSGKFFFPIKVYRNRPRLDNQPYVPDIYFQDIHDINALQNFILEKIKSPQNANPKGRK